METESDIMIEMIREVFNRKGHDWDHKMTISSYRYEGEKILIWYNIWYSFDIKEKQEKFITFPWSKKVEAEIEKKPTLGLVSIDKEEYELKVAYREADKRNKKIDKILNGSI